MEHNIKPPVEILISEADIARVRGLMGSLGVVDALQDELPEDHHHIDERWVQLSEN